MEKMLDARQESTCGSRGVNTLAGGDSGNIGFRVNCNEYVLILINDFGFQVGQKQDVAQIKSNVPPKYRKDFERGLQL